MRNPASILFWRNVLLIGSLACLAASIIMGLRPWEAFQKPIEALVLGMIVVAGLFVALGTREFGQLLFGEDDGPWWGCFGGGLFTAAMTILVSWLVQAIGVFASQIPSDYLARLLLLQGSQLLCVVLLDWPAVQVQPPRPQPPSKPKPTDTWRDLDDWKSKVSRKPHSED